VGRICIETYNREGEFVQSSVRVVPQTVPAASMLELCQDLRAAAEDNQAVTADGSAGPSRASLASISTTLQIVGMSAALAPVREAVKTYVVKPPTLMDVVMSGLQLKLQTQLRDTQPLATPWSAGLAIGQCCQSRFPVMLAGQPLFDCRLVAGPNVPPYHLTSGMLLFEAVHPQKTENRLTIRVLAAKRLGPRLEN
jgi:hypothetical protein